MTNCGRQDFDLIDSRLHFARMEGVERDWEGQRLQLELDWLS